MCVHGSQAVYCIPELCLSVDEAEEEKKKKNREGTMLVYILSTVKTENTCTSFLHRKTDWECGDSSVD